MAKFRKKPVVIEAVQLTDQTIMEAYRFCHPHEDLTLRSSDLSHWETYEQIVKESGMKLKTPESGEGTQIASIGDYIVKGNSPDLGDHFWPVKPDYFKLHYEPVE